MLLEKFTSSLMRPFQHGFYTRKGGVSSGIYSGLNCGAGSSDKKKNIYRNLNYVKNNMNLAEGYLVGINQIHSPIALVVNKPFKKKPKADAIVTSEPNLGLSILTADCQPVFFAEPENGIIGAAHAGWRGTLGGILEATICKMESIGAKRNAIRAVIGPCISQKAYEVGIEFFERFADEDPSSVPFFLIGKRHDKYLFNLPSFALHRLRQAGIQDCNWTGHCTFSDPSRFFSYRRSTHAKEVDYGRLISVIKINSSI